MSFDSNKKKDNLGKVPLIVDTVNSQLSQLQNRFVEFIRDMDELEVYEKKLNKLTKAEYDNQKDLM